MVTTTRELSDILLAIKEDFTYIKNENLRLQEENNQLKQAIAALNKEPTNSL
jgi:regulator of replication initiation timing